MSREHRNSIFVESAEVLANDAFPGDQFVLRVRAPKLAAAARAGSFAHLRCDDLLPMRRPLSVMRADARRGWAEFLYKVVGPGTALLAEKQPGQVLSVLGPIGVPFSAPDTHPLPLLIGGGVGIPPMVFLADQLRNRNTQFQPFVIMGSEVPFPFTSRPSRTLVAGMPAGVIACMPLMEDWGIASRLASLQGVSGLFRRLRDGSGARLAGYPRRRTSPPGVCLCLWPDTHAVGHRGPCAGVFPALSGVPGGVHGLCRWRLRRLRGAHPHSRGSGHETRVRRRPGIRCVQCPLALNEESRKATRRRARTSP